MAMVGIPPRIPHQTSDYSVIHGLRAAVEAISEPTEQQKEHLVQGKLSSKNFLNKGRVICITSARDDASMKSLEDIFHTVIVQQNALSAAHKSDLMPIDYCHLVIINLYPSNMESMVNDRAQQEVILLFLFSRKIAWCICLLPDHADTVNGNSFGEGVRNFQQTHPSDPIPLRSRQHNSHIHPDERRTKCQLQCEL